MTVLEQRFMQQVPGLLHDIAESLKTIAKKVAEEPKYVWVFTAEQTYGYEVLDVIVQAFGTEDAAHEFLHDFVYGGGDDSIANMVKTRDWEVEVDEAELYRAFPEGRYAEEHVELTITKCKIKK